MTDEPVLAIGVDGGASGVRALAVRRRPDGFLEAVGEVARRDHGPFEARDLEDQLAERADPQPDPVEVAAARARIRATADALAEVAGEARRIVLGICWPGVKTADGRGVAVIRNGPRDPRFLDELERELGARGFQLAKPMPSLASDGVAGALGERWAAAGRLHDVQDALYFAGGTGLAEALLVEGRVLSLDESDTPLPKAWQLEFEFSHVDSKLVLYEDALSPGRWSRAGVTAHPMLGVKPRSGSTDWAEVLKHDPQKARFLLAMAARALVRYIQDRMQRLRDPAGFVPECAVVGARLGVLLALPDLRTVFHDRVVEGLRAAGLPPAFVRASTLLEAPCFGAAALALGLEDESCPS